MEKRDEIINNFHFQINHFLYSLVHALLEGGWGIPKNGLATVALLPQPTKSVHEILAQISDVVDVSLQFTKSVRDAIGLIVSDGLVVGGDKGQGGAQEGDEEECLLHGSSSLAGVLGK